MIGVYSLAATLAGDQQSFGCYLFLLVTEQHCLMCFGIYRPFWPTDDVKFILFYLQYCFHNIIKHSNRTFAEACLSFMMWHRLWLQVIITFIAVNTRSQLSSKLWKITTLPQWDLAEDVWEGVSAVYLAAGGMKRVVKGYSCAAVSLCVCACGCGCVCVCVCLSLVCD